MMRKFLVLAIWMAGFCLPAFSQSIDPLLPDTAVVKFGFFNGAKIPGLADTIDFKKFLSQSDHRKYLLNPNPAAKEVQIGRLSNDRITAPGSGGYMPCYNPPGTFRMPVYKPDSAIRYTLLIKKQ